MENKYFGDKKFYGKVLTVAVPIMIQNGITNLVGLLDNLMVGRLGTDQMSGVSIVNQLIFVFSLCIFGGMSGIGIFAAQFYGKGDNKGVRYTFRMEVLSGLIIVLAGFLVFFFFGDNLISYFLHQDQGSYSSGSIEETFRFAKNYLSIMYLEFLPFAMVQVYAGTLRATGETIVPMKAGIIAVFVNLIGNYILIYGKFGAPALGVMGAAAATVLSRFVELFYVVFYTHRNKEKNKFIVGAYKNLFDIPSSLTGRIIIKATPLLLNEGLWSAGQAMLTQNYSIRGLSAVAGLSISSTISNVFNVCFIAMGSATAILLGQILGRGEIERAKKDAVKLTVFSVLLCFLMGALLFSVSGIFPKLYNTTDDVRNIATGIIRISAVFMPVYAFENSVYFTIRSGGKTFVTFIFDSCFVWIVSIPFAAFLSRYTALPVVTIFLYVQLAEFIKCVIGYVMMKRGKWAVDLTKE